MPTPRKPRAPRAKPGTSPGNAARGEHSLELGGRTYLLRPSMEAVNAIEDALDLSSAQILARANASALRLAEVAVIMAELVRAGAAADDAMTKGVSPAGMEPLVYERGVAGLMPFLTLLFLEVVSGGRDREGNVAAVSMTTGTTTTA